MAKTFKAIWLGDEDPQAQIIHMGELRFIKGEPTDVPEDHGFASFVRGNPTFAIDDAKASPVEADEPDADEIAARSEEGTEKGAIKARLRELGVTIQGNPSLDTLRGKLVDATK